MLRGNVGAAETMLVQALNDFPDSSELRRIQAHLLLQAGRSAEGITALRALLDKDPGDAASAFILARVLIGQSRTAAAAQTMLACFANEVNRKDAELAISAIELLDDAGRKADAASIARVTIAANPSDTRLHAYAGMLLAQRGEFEPARGHYLTALERDERAWEWHVPIGLSATYRYVELAHPDVAMFEAGLTRPGLSELARAELHFAIAKVHDDVGRYSVAATHLRPGNAMYHRLSPWPHKSWRCAIEAKLASAPSGAATPATPGFVPVFIVGMPRTGTTLLATHLARDPAVCNRGEPTWLAQLAQRFEPGGAANPATLQAAAGEYARWSRQDDADHCRWFIDKQPLNFRFVDLALAMFPDARILHCVRSARDTALSLWMQCFLGGAQGYSYDFDEIQRVMRDESRLMAHWQRLYPDAIRVVRYEDLVSNPRGVLAGIAGWLGLSAWPPDASPSEPASSISTASLWQARQPVYMHAIGRWRRYAEWVPELLRFSE
ncbi:MAG: tetratricopeptide repeat-containing sulfotransferase family protein [Rhodanobacteraceae bacterium]